MEAREQKPALACAVIDLSISLTDLMFMQPKRRQQIKASAKAGKTLRRQMVTVRNRQLVRGFDRLPVIAIDSARLLEQDR